MQKGRYRSAANRSPLLRVAGLSFLFILLTLVMSLWVEVLSGPGYPRLQAGEANASVADQGGTQVAGPSYGFLPAVLWMSLPGSPSTGTPADPATATFTPTPTATSTPTDTPTPTPSPTPSSSGWWDPRWRARVWIQVDAAGHSRTDKVVEPAIDFTQKLQDAGLSGTFDEAHLRVLEVDASGYVLDDQVPFQFDRDPDYQAASKASGRLVLMAQGQTGSLQTRYFLAYFDTVENSNGKPPAEVSTRISYQDGVQYEGQASYAIASENATYYYHKQGAGFAGMYDGDAIDWIGYHPTGDAAGNYRGIPNLATQGEGGTLGLFHPGYTSATSTILNSGPIKLTIKSQTKDGDWAKIWEIYPQYATMTLLKKPADKQYWILYEGTPGGSISEGDYYVLPDGVRYDLYTELDADLPGEEWAYFGDDEGGTVLYAINHQLDDALDCHYILHDSMTVFGFGRDRNKVSEKLLDALPGQYTFGFAQANGQQSIEEVIRAAYKPMAVTVGSGEHQ